MPAKPQAVPQYRITDGNRKTVLRTSDLELAMSLLREFDKAALYRVADGAVLAYRGPAPKDSSDYRVRKKKETH
jgi:hypothetical protein